MRKTIVKAIKCKNYDGHMVLMKDKLGLRKLLLLLLHFMMMELQFLNMIM